MKNEQRNTRRAVWPTGYFFMLKILLKKEVDVMAVVYATLIIKGRKTIDQVPAIIRDEVKQILKDLEVEV